MRQCLTWSDPRLGNSFSFCKSVSTRLIAVHPHSYFLVSLQPLVQQKGRGGLTARGEGGTPVCSEVEGSNLCQWQGDETAQHYALIQTVANDDRAQNSLAAGSGLYRREEKWVKTRCRKVYDDRLDAKCSRGRCWNETLTWSLWRWRKCLLQTFEKCSIDIYLYGFCVLQQPWEN